MGEGSPDEAAKLLWECARSKEPWAIQALLARVAPQETRLKIGPEGPTNGAYDLSRLTDAELELFIELAARARGAAGELKAGRTIDAVAQLPAGGESETAAS